MASMCTVRLLLDGDPEPESTKVWLTSAPVGPLKVGDHDWAQPVRPLMEVSHQGLQDTIRPLIFSQSSANPKIVCFIDHCSVQSGLSEWIANWDAQSMGVYLSPDLQESPERWLSDILAVCASQLSELHIIGGHHDPSHMLNWVARATQPYEHVVFEH